MQAERGVRAVSAGVSTIADGAHSNRLERETFATRKSHRHQFGIVSPRGFCYVARVSSFEREMSAAVKDVQRAVFLDLIRSHPEMTLAELSKLSKGQFSSLLSSVTVGEVINAGRDGERSTKAITPSFHEDEGEDEDERDEDDDDEDDGEEGSDVNTRTAAGRREYDNRVLEFVRNSDDAVSATEIRNHVGGTSLQVRKSVARLIEAEQVTWQGKARGTRYSLV
jgi:hypothetical protein